MCVCVAAIARRKVDVSNDAVVTAINRRVTDDDIVVSV